KLATCKGVRVLHAKPQWNETQSSSLTSLTKLLLWTSATTFVITGSPNSSLPSRLRTGSYSTCSGPFSSPTTLPQEIRHLSIRRATFSSGCPVGLIRASGDELMLENALNT